MKQTKNDMIDEAKQHALTDHGTDIIYPVGEHETFDDCFTECEGMLILWFDVEIDIGNNTVGHTTKIITRDIVE